MCLCIVRSDALEISSVVPSADPPTGAFKSEGQKSRLNKRKVANDTLTQNREELFAGEFEGCDGFL